MKRIAVIGGGNGGQAIAGHLGLLGYDVMLYSTNNEKIKIINKNGFIKVYGELEGNGRIKLATSDISEAVKKAELIIIALPSIYHEEVEKKMIPYLDDGQIIMILPEASCGALFFKALLKKMNCNKKIIIGAGATLPYTCRSSNYGEVNVICVKNEVKIAALPATDNIKLEKVFSSIYPSFKTCSSVLETSLDNINAFVHPAPVLLNVARIEAVPAQNYEYYRDGITPSIAKVLEKLDDERRSISKSFGYNHRTIEKEFIDMYQCGKDGDSLVDLIHNNPGYFGIMNVKSMNERYTLEDIPFSLVAFKSLALIANVKTPIIDSLIIIGKAMLGDKLVEGRTLKELGLENVSKKEFLKMILG